MSFGGKKKSFIYTKEVGDLISYVILMSSGKKKDSWPSITPVSLSFLYMAAKVTPTQRGAGGGCEPALPAFGLKLGLLVRCHTKKGG